MTYPKYPILQYGKDYQYSEELITLKGKRVKKLVDVDSQKAFFKYQAQDYRTTELCSEKLAYEIAKELGFDCARVELAQDQDGQMGILNYLFSSPPHLIHTDIADYLNAATSSRKDFYTISHIQTVLDDIDESLFSGFIRIMVFDTLIGEQDRHEENWGILKSRKGTATISPLYDNGCSLVRDLVDNADFAAYEAGTKDFAEYSNRSKTYFYKEPQYIKQGEGLRYKHFELIDRLALAYPEILEPELATVTRLEDDKITEIVNHMPNELLTELHKTYIIKYIKLRKQKLLKKYQELY